MLGFKQRRKYDHRFATRNTKYVFQYRQRKNITPEALAREAIIEWLEDLCDTKEADSLHQEFVKDKEFVLANHLYEELAFK